MFIAYSKKEDRLLFAGETAQLLSHYKNKGDLECPRSKVAVTFVQEAVTGKRAHFRIYPHATEEEKMLYDKYNKSRGKGRRHEECQGYLIERLMERHKGEILRDECRIEEEYRIGDRIADVVKIQKAANSETITVYEVQFSPITLSELMQRTKDYKKDSRVRQVWWFFEKEKVANNAFKSYLQDQGDVYGTVIARVEEKIVRL